MSRFHIGAERVRLRSVILSLILAVSENGVIGDTQSPHQQLPWNLPDDLAYFRRTTEGKPLIMGRKTHQAIGRVLPGRRNIVLSRQADYQPLAGAEKVGSFEEAIALAHVGDPEEVFVIGGAEVFRQALPQADRVYLTRVHADVPGDAYFESLNPEEWHLVSQAEHQEDDRHAHGFTFERWDRRLAAYESELVAAVPAPEPEVPLPPLI